jgi:hypothetical protein
MDRALGWANLVLGVGLGIYTGILLNTMVARPLWNSAILGPLFLVSGLSAGAAVMHIAASLLQGRAAPQGMVGGAFSAMLQPMGPQHPPKKTTAQSLVRYDQIFLVAELVFIALLLINLHTSRPRTRWPPRSSRAVPTRCPSGAAWWASAWCCRWPGRPGAGAQGPAHRVAGRPGARRRLHAALGHGQRRPDERDRAGVRSMP